MKKSYFEDTAEGVKEFRREQEKIHKYIDSMKTFILVSESKCFDFLDETDNLFDKYEYINLIEDKPSNYYKFQSRQRHTELDRKELIELIRAIQHVEEILDGFFK